MYARHEKELCFTNPTVSSVVHLFLNDAYAYAFAYAYVYARHQ